MQRKAAIQSVALLLLFASSVFCFAKENTQQKNIEVPLSYNGQLSVALAREYVGQTKYVDALKLADDAIRSDPKSGVPYMIKAFILDKQGDTKKSDKLYAKAIALSPGNGYVRNAFATHLCQQKEYEQADKNFLIATQDPHYQMAYQAYENAALCAFENGNLPLAESHARASLSLNPDSSNALTTMTQIKIKQSKFFEARAFLQRLEALGPLNVPLLRIAYQIEEAIGDNRSAARYQKQLDIVLQSQIQPPTGEGQKKP